MSGFNLKPQDSDVIFALFYIACNILKIFSPNSQPRMAKSTSIAIVGAGFAGLATAHHLQQAGYSPVLYEATDRVGGRVQSQKGLLHESLITELGAEFIDEHHTDMLEMLKEFGLETILRDNSGRSRARRHYYAKGKERSSDEIREAVEPFLPQILADCEKLDAGDYTTFDQMTAAEYLDQFPMPDWLRAIWNSAITGMYGLEPEFNSAINLLWLRPEIKDGEFMPFGDPGQTRTVKGGNNLLARTIADTLHQPIRFNKRLKAVRSNGAGVELSFEDGETSHFDWIIIAIPFSVLRNIELDIDLPQTLRRFIDELDYGTNSKAMFGFEEAIWREQNSSGSISTDEGPFNTWDNGENQGGKAAGLTVYLGGQIGVDIGDMSPGELYDTFIPAFEKVLPGAGTCTTGESSIGIHWPTFDLALGSYACYGKQQWDAFIKHHVYSEEMNMTDGVQAGRVLFAGEHLSADFQGYMNGALQTGRLAAHALIDTLKDNS